MKLLSIIIILLVTVIAVAFWKDIRNVSARRSSRDKKKIDGRNGVANATKKNS